MSHCWIVTASAAKAAIWESRSLGSELREVIRLEHSASRAHAHDLVTDHAGKSSDSSHPGSRGMGTDQNPVVHEHETFAKELATYLAKALSERRYERLLIAAAPKFLGMMREELDGQCHKALLAELVRDLTTADGTEVRAAFEGVAKF